MSRLDQSIAAVRDGSSIYWGFFHPEEVTDAGTTVEVRLNASAEAAASFIPPGRWAVDRVQWEDTIFLRREQAVDRGSIEDMLIEVLEIAALHGMQFHSWLLGDDLG